ncbi:hypothetical protein [Streptomyces sp. NPDC005408]|uniref:hypothetical protein n=1 Tax=Streptomyces sp. NPDC005408 TaxID=3155341 RepID=UPI0033B182CC
MQTGLCLDGNDSGAIYALPCDPNARNPYQEWQRSTTERAIFNPKTTRALSADSPHVIGGAYLDLDLQHWTVTNVDGACEMEPLAMVIDEVRPDMWRDFTKTEQSTDGLGYRWKFTVQENKELSVSATWTPASVSSSASTSSRRPHRKN